MTDYHGAEWDLKRYDEWVKQVAKYKKEYEEHKQSAVNERTDIERYNRALEEEIPGSQENQHDDIEYRDWLEINIRSAERMLCVIDARTQTSLENYSMSKNKEMEMEEMRERAIKTLQEKEEPEGYIKGKMRYAKDNLEISKLDINGLFDD